mmetsp:Transcript_10561/g.12129  ORF Transcript_10561/g.12129 Transcript_10561/m.12129 type:complete len:325 (+) Transcript_10561:366-1340(+)
MQTNLLEKQLAGFQLPMINSIQASVTHSPSVFPNSLLMSGLSMPQGVFQDKPSFTGAAPLTVVPQNIVPQLIPSALNLLDLYNGSSKTFWSSSNVQQLPNKTIATPHQVGLSMSALDPSNLVSNKEICLSAVSRKRKSPDGNALTQTDVTDSESSSKFGEVSGKKKRKGRQRKRCAFITGCTKLSQGNTKFCFSHGGGYRCQDKSCKKPARGRTGFCIAHGGGKRCTFPDCTKSAQGKTSLCKRHGGGRRCQFPACKTSARGKTNFCTAHGGGRRCEIASCNKSARDNSSFCVAHGGGKRCVFDNCAKSAVGSTKFCTRHKPDC